MNHERHKNHEKRENPDHTDFHAMRATSRAVPKLRFPEFRDSGEWESSQLQQFSTVIRGASPRPQGDPRYYGGTVPRLMGKDVSRDGKWVTPRIDYLTDEGAKLSRFCKKGTLTVICSGEVGVPSFLAVDACIHDGFLALIDIDSDLVNPEFLYYSLYNVQNQFSSAATHGGVFVNLTTTILKEFSIYKPNLVEQQRIADCLTSLDAVITAEVQKLDALKAHKKGLMQQLFPAEGEAVPKRRFPEFRDSGEWEEKELREKVDLLSGHPFDGPDISQDKSGIPLLRGINVTEGRIRHNEEIDRYYTRSVNGLEKFMVQTNDLVIGMDGSKVGKNSALISEADSGALLIQRVARLRGQNSSLIQFIFQRINSPAFHAYVDRINTSSGIPHISAKQIKEFRICFPSEAEQRKIADCLSALDELIAAQAEKIEALKLQKKGLMQGLFPQQGSSE